MITIIENVSLKLYSTMRLGGTARYVCEVHSEQDLLEAVMFASEHQLTLRVIGDGSNIVWRDEGFAGLLVVNKIDGFNVLEDGETVQIGAGTNWDQAVAKSVAVGLSGIEFLSLIPGTTGATPVQNVGAYGTEIKNVFVSLKAYDMHQKEFVSLSREECAFGYRTSRFKTTDAGRFVIVSVVLKLSKNQPTPPFYDALQAYFNEHGITDFSPLIIRESVIRIRNAKLPDPAMVANNGSFFANPIVSTAVFETLQQQYPGIKGWPFGDGVKLAAGWLVEQADFKDVHDEPTGMATWHAQSLVLINEHAQTTADLLKFKQKIIEAVQQKFGVTLEQEPELLP